MWKVCRKKRYEVMTVLAYLMSRCIRQEERYVHWDVSIKYRANKGKRIEFIVTLSNWSTEHCVWCHYLQAFSYKPRCAHFVACNFQQLKTIIRMVAKRFAWVSISILNFYCIKIVLCNFGMDKPTFSSIIFNIDVIHESKLAALLWRFYIWAVWLLMHVMLIAGNIKLLSTLKRFYFCVLYQTSFLNTHQINNSKTQLCWLQVCLTGFCMTAYQHMWQYAFKSQIWYYLAE